VLLLLLGLLRSAVAVPPCPSKICNAAFSNAQGGPIDCCKWDFNKGPCRWGGTPVSWRVVRTCSDAAKAYTVLTSSNSQGNPAGDGECRCNEPNGPQYAVAQVGPGQQGAGCVCGGEGERDPCM
jgi:hypothetical protein